MEFFEEVVGLLRAQTAGYQTGTSHTQQMRDGPGSLIWKSDTEELTFMLPSFQATRRPHISQLLHPGGSQAHGTTLAIWLQIFDSLSLCFSS